MYVGHQGSLKKQLHLLCNQGYRFNSPSEASFIAAQISSYLAGLAKLTVRSTTETSKVGTRIDIPVNLPFNSGMTLPTALAAPVDEADDVARSSTATTPVFHWKTVNGFLCSCCRVYGSHQTICYTKLVVQYLCNRSETVGCARCIRNKLCTLYIFILINTANEHWGVVL